MTEAITPIVSLPSPSLAETMPRAPSAGVPVSIDSLAPNTPPAPPATESQLKSAAQAMTQSPEARQTDLRFQVDKLTEQLVVSVIDSKNGTVLLQMPSAEALSIAQSLETEQMKLLDRKA